ncbi:hypothetical protein ASE63_21925 [Bosea sp. Root381]|uniref:carbohydrate ABC transporter permease n=1 Tax=Bosea sp. Root381 TaxID=1736524 RepID=UPI0006FED40C|nr:sugar ABC transporter permease [Bosea sp. Root381]KRE07994.1 hypothetical protein ASE63_21925 [Bosea sp. Root381]
MTLTDTRARRSPHRAKIDLFPYALMAPGLLLVLFATLYPVIFVVQYSLFSTNVYEMVRFVGAANYVFLFQDERFLENLWNTAVFVIVGVALCWTFGLTLALALRRQSWGTAVLRAIVLVPWVTNQVVLALMWKLLLGGEFSPLNDLLRSVGLPPVNPFISLEQALPTLTVINAWRATGFAMLMLLAGLAAIPKEVDEAAEVDGATKLQQIRYVIIPMLRPISMVCIVTLMISFFNVAVLPLVLTGGGPLHATELLSIRLYREGFENFDIALAATLTVFLIAIELLLAALYFRLVKAGAQS